MKRKWMILTVAAVLSVGGAAYCVYNNCCKTACKADAPACCHK